MKKYEEAKVQVKAQEIADKVLKMNDADYRRFVKKLQSEINMLNLGIDETKARLHEIEEKPVKKLAEGDSNIITMVGGAAGLVGSIIACANQLAPINFVDTLIMGTSALGAAGLGVIAGALAAVVIENNPIDKGVKGVQKYFNKRKLARMQDQLFEKDAIMDEICEEAVSQGMGL